MINIENNYQIPDQNYKTALSLDMKAWEFRTCDKTIVVYKKDEIRKTR
jgi:hypothetical protein